MPEQNEQETGQENKSGTPDQSAALGEKNEKNYVPQSVFSEQQKRLRAAEERIAAMEAEQKAETDKRLTEQSQFKELAEKRGRELAEAQAEAAKLTSMEKVLQDVLASQVAALPEDKRALVPDDLTTQQKLTWLAKNAAILKAPAAFDIGAGRGAGGGGDRGVNLTPEELAVAKAFGMTPEEYAKNK